MRIIDINGDDAPVNTAVLQELARRAEQWDDPLEGMDQFCAIARRHLPRFPEMTNEPLAEFGEERGSN